MKEETLKISKMDYKGFQYEVKQKYGKNEDEVVGTALYDDGMRIIVSMVHRKKQSWFTAELYDDAWRFIKGTKKEADDIMKFNGTEYKNKDGEKYRLTVAIQ